MSYGIVRIAKMSAGSVKGIEIHDRRKKEGVSHSNSDIDWSKSKQNYDLNPAQNDNFNRAVKERISQLDLKKAVRKDAVVMAQCLVTSDHSFFDQLTPDQTRQFFQDSYDFLAKKYGAENIVSATVHLDERTPHMHFNFVPVTEDGRLSAKSIFRYRTDLSKLHDDFYKVVGKRYDLDRGEQAAEGEFKKHLETAELKNQTLQIELQATQKELRKLEGERDKLLADIKTGRGELKHMQSVDSISTKLSLLGDKVSLSTEDFTKIKELARQSNRLFEDNLTLKKKIEADKGKTSIEVLRLRAEVKSLKEKIANPRSKVIQLKPEIER